jgi:hypothetical protein
MLKRHIDRRRAVLAVLPAARPASLTINEIADRLDAQDVEPPDPKRLSDLLRNQVNNGHVLKRGRATFAAGYLSRSTEWRVWNWRLLAARAEAAASAQRVPVKYS